MIVELFHRQIDAGDDVMEIVRAEGAAHVSIYSGPFVLQIDLRDLGPIIGMLAMAVASPKSTVPQLNLADGHALHVGIGIDQAHLWISAANAHLRLPLHTANALLAALSEARAHVTRKLDAWRSEQAVRETSKC